MTVNNKIKLIKQDWAYIFSVKKGKLIERGDRCYQVNKFFSWIFYLYYYSGLVFLVVFFIFLLQPHYFHNIIMRGMETLVVYFALETIVFFLLPVKKIVCRDKHSLA